MFIKDSLSREEHMMNRKANRLRAYEWVVSQVKNSGTPPIQSDKQLADLCDIPVEEVISLKNGLIDPPPKLVRNVKSFLGPTVRDEEIDGYLVKPFKSV